MCAGRGGERDPRRGCDRSRRARGLPPADPGRDAGAGTRASELGSRHGRRAPDDGHRDGRGRRPRPLVDGSGGPRCRRRRVHDLGDALPVRARRERPRDRRQGRRAPPGRRRGRRRRHEVRVHVVLGAHESSVPARRREAVRRGLAQGEPAGLDDPPAQLLHGGLAEPDGRVRPGARDGDDLRHRRAPDQLDLEERRGVVRRGEPHARGGAQGGARARRAGARSRRSRSSGSSSPSPAGRST